MKKNEEEKEPIKISIWIIVSIFIITLFACLISFLFIRLGVENNKLSKNSTIYEEKSIKNADTKSSTDFFKKVKAALNDSEIPINEEIKDETICNMIGINLENFIQLKNTFIGESTEKTDFDIEKITKYQNEAIKNFRTIEEYTKNNDSTITKSILEAIDNKDIYGKRFSEDDINKFYTYVCSGLIKYHLKLKSYNLNMVEYKIERDYNEIIITVNDECYISFKYNDSYCTFDVAEAAYKNHVFTKRLEGYESIKEFYESLEKGHFRVDPAKPIIYFYPTKETDIEVKLGNPHFLSCSYPKYEDSWKVLAKPNGDLIDKKTGRNLYALYWEGKNIPKEIKMQEGFCIKGEETAEFLEEKLAILGLNEREAEEFIVYWLPQMEDNKYNYIRFETMEEQENAMPLEVTPKPDNIIRVMMDWKSLNEPIEVQEQELDTPSRNGYIVVEWGGSKIE